MTSRLTATTNDSIVTARSAPAAFDQLLLQNLCAAHISGNQQMHIEETCSALEFMRSLCEGHFFLVQDQLTHQPNSRRSVNILRWTIRLLDRLFRCYQEVCLLLQYYVRMINVYITYICVALFLAFGMHKLMQAEMTLVQTQNLAISIIDFLTESTQVDGILLSLFNCIDKALWENLASDA